MNPFPPVSKDYYAILGLTPSCSLEDVKRAFRRKARECHPDMFPGDTAKEAQFKDVNEAHEVLEDPEKRRLYDLERLSPGSKLPSAPARKPPTSSKPGSIPTAPKAPAPVPEPDFFSGFGSFDELLTSLFQTEEDVAVVPPPAVLVLSAREAFNGCARTFSIEGRTQERKFPAGVKTGSKLTLAPGVSTTIQVDFSGTKYRFDGENLICVLPISEDEAKTGGIIRSHPTPWGTVELKIPKGLTTGKRIKLSRKGWPKGTSWSSLSPAQRTLLSDPTDHPLSAQELLQVGLVSDLLFEISIVADTAPRRDWISHLWVLAERTVG